MTDSGAQDGIPSFRIWTCGPFLVERWDGCRYQPVRTGEWGGSSYPRLLLKVLVCQRGRQARRGEVLEHLWPEMDPEESGVYLNDAAYRLRTVLRPGKGEQSLLLTGENASNYHLAEQHQLWVDADAALSLLEQAEAAEHAGVDPLPLVEEAMQYLVRGAFLGEEEQLWAYGRRATLERARHGCVLWQARLYQQRGQLRKAERLLCMLLEENPIDEDALCSLITNLHQQQRTSEALRLFRHTARLLQEDGLEITASTRALAERLRTHAETHLPGQDGKHAPPISSSTHSQALAAIESIPLQLSPHSSADQGQTHALDMLFTTDATLQEQLGAWLALGASGLSSLFDAGWSIESVLDALRVVLQGIQRMPVLSRRTLLQLGAAALVSGIPVLPGKHISEEERVQLTRALGESIGGGWKFFSVAATEQTLAIGQAQLYILQNLHSTLYSAVRPIFYSAVYNLIGSALCFKEYYSEALHAHSSAYIAALEAGDPWSMAQSLNWQAYVYHALGQYAEAIQAIDAALRLVSYRIDEMCMRLKGHLLASWAENAAMIGEDAIVQEKLEASEALLDRIPPNEEFDRERWLQQAGNCALRSGDYKIAIERFEKALAGLPQSWLLRRAITVIPLAVAYTRIQEREASLAVAKKAMPVVSAMNAPAINKQFGEYINHDLLGSFPHDSRIRAFVTDVRSLFPQLS